MVTVIPMDEEAVAEARKEQAEEWQDAYYTGVGRPNLDNTRQDESEGKRLLMSERRSLGL